MAKRYAHAWFYESEIIEAAAEVLSVGSPLPAEPSARRAFDWYWSAARAAGWRLVATTAQNGVWNVVWEGEDTICGPGVAELAAASIEKAKDGA